jgi:hypothetical protein
MYLFNIELFMWFVANKTLVRSFYLQHAGFFLFLFIVFFGIVAPSQQLAYHYALIRGILEAPVFLALVAFTWLLYAGKVVQFVFRVLDSREGLFVCRLRSLPPVRCLRLLLRIQHRLFLPVSGYALIIVGVAIHRGAWVIASVAVGYVVLICGATAILYYRRLGHPGGDGQTRELACYPKPAKGPLLGRPIAVLTGRQWVAVNRDQGLFLRFCSAVAG